MEKKEDLVLSVFDGKRSNLMPSEVVVATIFSVFLSISNTKTIYKKKGNVILDNLLSLGYI